MAQSALSEARHANETWAFSSETETVALAQHTLVCLVAASLQCGHANRMQTEQDLLELVVRSQEGRGHQESCL